MDQHRGAAQAGGIIGNPKILLVEAIAAAEDEGEPPAELRLAWDIQRWGATAVTGNQGLDYGLIRRMNVASNVYDAVKAVRTAKGDEIHRVADLPLWKTFEWLKLEGLVE